MFTPQFGVRRRPNNEDKNVETGNFADICVPSTMPALSKLIQARQNMTCQLEVETRETGPHCVIFCDIIEKDTFFAAFTTKKNGGFRGVSKKSLKNIRLVSLE